MIMHAYRTFRWKDSNFRISCAEFACVTAEIVRQRELLDAYIARHPQFRTSFVPLGLLADAPPVARRMQSAALKVGVGPMAAVAGAIAQLAIEAALEAGAEDTVVENGGDIYIAANREVMVGLYAGRNAVGSRLALRVPASMLPLAVCSSSSRMGHSESLGKCDLATILAKDAALADAAATLACNLVRTPDMIESALERLLTIPGVQGALLLCEDRIGMAGDLPPLVRNRDANAETKITRDYASRG